MVFFAADDGKLTSQVLDHLSQVTRAFPTVRQSLRFVNGLPTQVQAMILKQRNDPRKQRGRAGKLSQGVQGSRFRRRIVPGPCLCHLQGAYTKASL